MAGYCDVIVEVASQALDRVFTYAVGELPGIVPGMRVSVPFGPRHVEGYVLALREHTELAPERVRPVLHALDAFPALTPDQLELAHWICRNYRCLLVDALRLMLPAQMRGGRVREKQALYAEAVPEGEALELAIAGLARARRQRDVLEALREGAQSLADLTRRIPGARDALRALAEQGHARITSREQLRTPYAALQGAPDTRVQLTYAQQSALEELLRLPPERYAGYLLHGITGSGKTEVYMRAIAHMLEQERSAIVLVPEIALTPQMVERFRARFGDLAAVLHSQLSPGERYDEWRRIRAGRARVVIGARSAIFAPLSRIGLIVVDEEHESSYLSEKRPCYDAREVAEQRCRQHGALLLLGSATPSIRSYMRCMPGVRPENKLMLLELPERANARPLPHVTVVDMRDELARGNRSIFSVALSRALENCLAQGRQAILFINRRGHSSFVSCRACGYVEKCDDCDVSLTYHQSDGLLHCHYCDARRAAPTVCPQCGSGFIKFFGTGTQKVEEELHKLHPGVGVLRMDMDTTRKKDAHADILSAFREGRAQVLVGTQMVAKGLDFPNVTLVGVVAADMSLNLPDFRSVERTFQLITQVAGRAGRAAHEGQVIVQTYDPAHYGIQLAASQDYRAFYAQESNRRRKGLYPPFTHIARLLVTSGDPEAAQSVAEALEAEFSVRLAEPELARQVVQMRAMEAPLSRLRGETRWQVYIKLYVRGPSARILDIMAELAALPREDAKVELEINPANMI